MDQLEAPRATASPPPMLAPREDAWTTRRITTAVVGALLGLVALVLLGAGGTAMWADLTKRDAGYVTTDIHQFSTAGSALATKPTELGSAGLGWLYGPDVLGKVRIRVTPRSSGGPLFVGIAPSADVDRYLTGVQHTVISDFWDESVKPVAGDSPNSAPGSQRFWAAQTSGTGSQTLVWEASEGSWTVVVMNADGRPGLDVDADLGAEMPPLVWIALGLLVAGLVFMAGALLLVAGAIRGAESERRWTHAADEGGGVGVPRA